MDPKTREEFMQYKDELEEWRPVPGFEKYYEVSNYGEVRSKSRAAWKKNGRSQRVKRKPVKAHKNHKGYPRVTLSVKGKRSHIFVHRLVMEAFGGEAPSPKHVVAHSDDNPDNNIIWNLRWATQSENERDKQ